jgi:hypothetical protein
MKREDRSSLAVSKDTRERLLKYITARMVEEGERVTVDGALNELLDFGERALQTNKEQRSELPLASPTSKARQAEKPRESKKHVKK